MLRRFCAIGMLMYEFPNNASISVMAFPLAFPLCKMRHGTAFNTNHHDGKRSVH